MAFGEREESGLWLDCCHQLVDLGNPGPCIQDTLEDSLYYFIPDDGNMIPID